MPVLYSNNAATALAASITSSTTSFSVVSGKGALFPAIVGADYFYVTLISASNSATMEVVKVTARSADTFTVVRAQDGTTGTAFSAGDKVELRIVKAMLDDFKADTRTGYLPLSGGTLTGPLVISTGSTNNNYNEGLRLTRAANNWAGITFGSTGSSGAPTGGWFAATNPSAQFIISPDDSSNTTGLTLNKDGNALWRNNILLHAGNYTSYTLPLGGSWYGSGLPGSRAYGVSISGGEFVLGNGLPTAGQLGVLIDGCYVAAENNGFWSMGSDNTWGSRRGFYWDGSNINFTVNSPQVAVTRLTVGGGGASSWINMEDSDEGVRYIHNNSSTIGFVANDGNWSYRVQDGGNVWFRNRGWFDDIVARKDSTSWQGGVGTRLWRRDGSDNYSVQTYWTGSRWRLYGYYNDSGHADTHVGYADSAGYLGGTWDSSGRNYNREWIEMPNYTGLYSPNNAAHFYPNNVSYGSWRIDGSRNGWVGLHFGDSGNTLMMNSNSLGVHREGYGWTYYWSGGTLYCYKNSTGGGTGAVVHDDVNCARVSVTGGSAPSYAARAYASWNNGAGVFYSQNVSSITLIASGYVVLNFSTALPTSNYTVGGASQTQASASYSNGVIGLPGDRSRSTSSCPIVNTVTNVGSQLAAAAYYCAVIFA